jgi:hypothetical protein
LKKLDSTMIQNGLLIILLSNQSITSPKYLNKTWKKETFLQKINRKITPA